MECLPEVSLPYQLESFGWGLCGLMLNFYDLVTNRGAFLDAYQTWFNALSSNGTPAVRWDCNCSV